MACCGRKRQALGKSAGLTTSLIPQTRIAISNLDVGKEQPDNVTASSTQNSVLIRYLQSSPLYVRGAVTGRQYLFSLSQPVLAVDTRDVENFLKSRAFRMA